MKTTGRFAFCYACVNYKNCDDKKRESCMEGKSAKHFEINKSQRSVVENYIKKEAEEK